MAGYGVVKQIKHIEESLDKLGLVMCRPRGIWDDDTVAVCPKDEESLPIYHRDAEMYCGTLQGLVDWIRGVEWARYYDELLRSHNGERISADERRLRREELVRQKQTIKRLKDESIELKG